MRSSDPIQTFRHEAADLLEQIQETALDLERRPTDTEAVNRLFRAFHTLKGSGAMFGFDAVAEFTHRVETALDRVRTGALSVDRGLLALILRARDQIQHLLDRADDPAVTAECRQIVTAFDALCGATSVAATSGSGKDKPDETEPAHWRISFRPSPNIATSGLDPVSLLEDLRRLGPCEITADTTAIPSLAELKPEECHVGWQITLTTDRGLNAIKDVFIFVEDESQISIEPVQRGTGVSPVQDTSADRDRSVTEPSPQPLAPRENVAAPTPHARKTLAHESSIRVPSTRLDQLVNLVGELVMNQSRLAQVASHIASAELAAPVESLERLVAELRDNVLGIRMMPIGTTFGRFKRLVHDLAAELGKEIDLVADGAETELDKTVLDRLGDPLVHLIRNSVDHGIEAPADRARVGKPPRGTIRLSATHIGSNVLLTVHDDGRGLDPDALRAKAIEKNLIPANAPLTRRECFSLILLPGFSTAQQVTAVSGRGVGMDVVKRELDALGASLSIESELGQGTTITATLPLTLAIIEGLLVAVGDEQFIIPLSAVHENVELPRAARLQHNGRNLVAVRGELVPYVVLRELFAVPGAEPELEKVVIVRHGPDRVGLVVDRVLGSHQTVIQSLGRFYRGIEVLSGATIMGDGRVALILDLAGLIRTADRLSGAGAA